MVSTNLDDKTSDFPKRELIAFVARVERIGPEPYGRTSFEFDAIDATIPEEDLERAILDPLEVAPFAVIRVVTTQRRFLELFKFEPKDGMWVELSIRPHDGVPGPITFHSQLQGDGYTEHTRGVLGDARLIFPPDEDPISPVSIGAAVAGTILKATEIVAICKFPRAAIGTNYRIRRILRKLSNIHRVQVRDVGQASFVSLLSKDDEILAHFDAGWPISFNAHTVPSTRPPVSGAAPVILSHWDWDHLHAYHGCAELRNTTWLVPDQRFGPGARKVASQLHSAGLLVGFAGQFECFPAGVLIRCSGKSTSNDTGLALIIQLCSGSVVLLVGDACYESLGSIFNSIEYDYIVATHHGADFAGPVPLAPKLGGHGVISVGSGNVYKHPRADAVQKHTLAGWTLLPTSSNSTVPRGDRYIGP
jgi:competence protein ComEC